MKFNFKSRKGFTLIELLVVIGILAVLAAIAIPSVAGLIDRANVSADKTNSNEMTNAVERFASEYELYCQDIASGALDPNNLDSAQGRVKNVVGVTTRSGIEGIEKPQSATAVGTTGIAIYRDTKYPVNAETMKKVVENYTKTSSSTFEPKQSDMHYWYSPDCGVVVVAEPTKTAAELDKYIISGMDAKGNDITSDSVNAQWIDLTIASPANSNVSFDNNIVPAGGVYYSNATVTTRDHGGQYQGVEWTSYDYANAVTYTSGDTVPMPQDGDKFVYGDFVYVYNGVAGDNSPPYDNFDENNEVYQPKNINGWYAHCNKRNVGSNNSVTISNLLPSINGKPLVDMGYAFGVYGNVHFDNIVIPETVTSIDNLFSGVYKATGSMILYVNENIEGYDQLYDTTYENVIAELQIIQK